MATKKQKIKKKVQKKVKRVIPTKSTSIKLNSLEKFMQKSDVLLMLYSKDEDGYFHHSIEEKDEITVYELLKERKTDKKSLLIALDTSGGNVYSATKIMDTLRCTYDNITIAILQEAKSSGTMMCCGADKLIMSPISALGPLDKPMPHPDKETTYVSALDIVKSIDGMIDIAIEKEKKFAKDLIGGTRLSQKDCHSISSDFTSKLISPMLCNEDVKVYNKAKRLLMIADVYGLEFLNKFMLKYIKNKASRNRIAKRVIRRLIWSYPDHSFAIRRNELSDWLFVVENAENKDYWDELWKEYKKTVGFNNKTIKFL